MAQHNAVWMVFTSDYDSSINGSRFLDPNILPNRHLSLISEKVRGIIFHHNFNLGFWKIRCSRYFDQRQAQRFQIGTKLNSVFRILQFSDSIEELHCKTRMGYEHNIHSWVISLRIDKAHELILDKLFRASHQVVPRLSAFIWH